MNFEQTVPVAGIVTFNGICVNDSPKEKIIRSYVSRQIARKLRQKKKYQWGNYIVHFEVLEQTSVIECSVDIRADGHRALRAHGRAERATLAFGNAMESLREQPDSLPLELTA